ncbi:hypothetical protein COOONC_19135 [Cooperia oncophora]
MYRCRLSPFDLPRKFNRGGQSILQPPPRLFCIDRYGRFNVNNACPVCRDEYLFFDYRNPALIEQFLSDGTHQPIAILKSGLCQEQYALLRAQLLAAKEHATAYKEVQEEQLRSVSTFEISTFGTGIRNGRNRHCLMWSVLEFAFKTFIQIHWCHSPRSSVISTMIGTNGGFDMTNLLARESDLNKCFWFIVFAEITYYSVQMVWLRVSVFLLLLMLSEQKGKSDRLKKQEKKKEEVEKVTVQKQEEEEKNELPLSHPPSSISKQSILKGHETVDFSPRKFENPVLVYVTPWNNKGYDLAKWVSHKVTHVSPVWLQVSSLLRTNVYAM